jgi:hypothetical protein
MMKCVSFRARDDAGWKETMMSGSEDQNTALLRRQRLIERLNAREAELSASQGIQPQLSEKELKAQIEKERQRNYLHMGFSQISG